MVHPERRTNLESIPEGVSTGRSLFLGRVQSSERVSVEEPSSSDGEASEQQDSTASGAARSLIRGKITSESWSMDGDSSGGDSSLGIVLTENEALGTSISSGERIRNGINDENSSLLSRRSSVPARRRRPPKRPILSDRSLSSVMMGTWEVPEVSEEKAESYLWRFRMACGSSVENPNVQFVIIFFILANAIILGVETFDFVTDDPKVDRIFNMIDTSFLIVFTVELGLQMIYRGVALFEDSWLIFDFIFVAISWSVEWLQVARSVRVFRAFRLVTRIESLRTLILAIGNVMPNLSAIAFLMLLVFYIFAVLFTQLFGDLELEQDYFGSLPKSLFTCLELTTLEWANQARQVMDHYSWAWLPFVSFVCVTGFIFFNLFIAVICDALKVVEKQAQKERKAEEMAQLQLESSFFEATSEERIKYLKEQIEALKKKEREIADAVSELAGEWELNRRELLRRQRQKQRQHRETLHLHRIASEKRRLQD